MIQKNNWQDKFQQAFDKAKSYNAVEMDEMKTLDDYYAWLDAQMTWVPTENQPGKIVYKHVCLFYFILDQEPVKSLQNAVMPHNPAEPLTPLSLWMRKYIQEFGKWMDQPEIAHPGSRTVLLRLPGLQHGHVHPAPRRMEDLQRIFRTPLQTGHAPNRSH